jgi:hypothetical protein
LDLFYSTLQAQIPSGLAPVFESIDGGTLAVPGDQFHNDEADLDLEYAIALGKSQAILQKLFCRLTTDIFISVSSKRYIISDRRQCARRFV